MRCEDAHRALPLTCETSDDDAAAVRAHATGCGACALLLEAFEADDQALEALAAEPRELPPIMNGFADAVMAAVAEEPRLAAAPAQPEGKVIKPVFGGASALMALAAMTLLAIGLGIVLSGDPTGSELLPTAQAPTPPVTPVVAQGDVEPLPAPRRAGEAPMPLRRRGRPGIGVPVDGGRTPQLPSGPLFDVLRDVQRAFPGGFNQRPPQRIPPLRPGEREVRF